MTNPRNCHEVALRPLVFDSVEAESAMVTTDHMYRGSGGRELHFDVYRPAQPACACPPVVLLTTGFPDDGMRKAIGCPAKAMQSYRSWARLIAGTGLAAVTYTITSPWLTRARFSNTCVTTVRHCKSMKPHRALGVFGERAQCALAAHERLAGRRCARSCTATCWISTAARRWLMRLASGALPILLPRACWTICRRTGPLLIVRAGRDAMAGVNDSIDRFTARALARNKPFTLVNVPEARHAFDTVDGTPASRHAIACVLAFLRQHLLDAS